MQQLSRKYLKSPEFIDLVGEDDVKIPATITHWSFATQRDTREDILELAATAYSSDKRSIVFTQVGFGGMIAWFTRVVLCTVVHLVLFTYVRVDGMMAWFTRVVLVVDVSVVSGCRLS